MPKFRVAHTRSDFRERFTEINYAIKSDSIDVTRGSMIVVLLDVDEPLAPRHVLLMRPLFRTPQRGSYKRLDRGRRWSRWPKHE